jgi:mRNA-degrading endonuclease RelE of RelBE toxin-antitoxin system
VARVRYSRNFLGSLKRLDRQPRERALKAIDKFMKDPRSPGLNLEKLLGFSSMWSIRITQGDRILLSRDEDEQGEIWTLHDLGPHDIYRKAGR